MGWRAFYALVGGAAVVVFLVFVLQGRAEVPPFAAAFAGAAVFETIYNTAVRNKAFNWRTALFALVGIAAYAGLAVWAFRLAQAPGSGGPLVVVGLVSGNFLADALTRKPTAAPPVDQGIG